MNLDSKHLKTVTHIFEKYMYTFIKIIMFIFFINITERGSKMSVLIDLI